MKIRIAGVLVGGIATMALTACNSTDQAAPPTPTTTTTVTSTVTAASAASTTQTKVPAGNAIGPNGYGKVKLGMTFADAQAAGLVGKNETAPGEFCEHYPLLVGGKRDGLLHITKDRGVEAITPDAVASTPEGVTAGWRDTKVKTVYSDLDLDQVKQNSRGLVRVPGNGTVKYRLNFRDGVVYSVGLQLADQKCYE